MKWFVSPKTKYKKNLRNHLGYLKSARGQRGPSSLPSYYYLHKELIFAQEIIICTGGRLPSYYYLHKELIFAQEIIICTGGRLPRNCVGDKNRLNHYTKLNHVLCKLLFAQEADCQEIV